MTSTPGMERHRHILELVTSVSYKDWDFWVGSRGEDTHTICAVFNADGQLQRGRSWLIEDSMSDSEIIRTLFLAVMVAEEHEIREHFTYKGKAIFGPHFDVDEVKR